MKSSLILLDSYTEARRAARYLASIKIHADVEKSTSGGSCAYGVRVNEPAEKVCRLLSSAGIRCGRIIG